MTREREAVWARLDVEYFRHPKVAPLSDAAVLMHLIAIVFSKEIGTNGVIKKDFPLKNLTRDRSARAARALWNELEKAGLVVEELLDREEVWVLHGFEERNGDDATRQAAREYERRRKAEQRERTRANGYYGEEAP